MDKIASWVRVSARPLRLAARAASLLMLVVIAPITSSVAADLDTEIVFHIVAQPLDSALLQFSKQANTPVAFAAKSIGSLRTTGLEGKFPVRTALAVLLCNSGLAYTQVGDTVTVVPISDGVDSKSCAALPAALRHRM